MNLKAVLSILSIIVVFGFAWSLYAGRLANLHESKGPIVHYVVLADNRAEPAIVLVKLGEYVEFVPKDGLTHDIASGKGNDYNKDHEHVLVGGIESGNFGPGEAYRIQFSKAGTYYFHDDLYPDIATTVVAYKEEI